MNPDKVLCVIPSRLGVGETFSIKLKLKGEPREIPCNNSWDTLGPQLKSPFNLAVGRNIKYIDDTLVEWQGVLQVEGGEALSCNGEVKGRHVRDALNLGYRFGFVGGGDIHDGRPGDCLNGHPGVTPGYRSGLAAVMVPELTRENVFDAIRNHQCYAATCSRIFLEVVLSETQLDIKCASEHGLKAVDIIRNGNVVESIPLAADSRVLESKLVIPALSGNDYVYVRATTNTSEMAWSSPVWSHER